MPDNPQFSFQVHKLMDNARRPALFTIALWEGTALRDICFARPLDDALAALRNVLEEAGKLAEVERG